MNIEFYKEVIKKSPVAYQLGKIICMENGEPYDYEYIDANDAGKKMIPCEEQEIISKTFRGLVGELNEKGEQWLQLCINIALNGGELSLNRFVSLCKKRVNIKIWSPEKNYFVAYFTDITQELREIEDLNNILTNLYEIVFELDDNYVFRKVYTKDEKMLFFPKEQILGKSVNEIYDDRFTKMMIDGIIKARITKSEVIITYPSINLANENWFSAMIKNIDTDYGSKAIIGINNITEQKEKEKQVMVFDNNPGEEITFVIDENYIFKSVNTKNEALLFLPKDKIINHSINEVFDNETTKTFIRLMGSSCYTKKEEMISFPSFNKNKDLTYISKIVCNNEGDKRFFILSLKCL